MTKNDFTRLCCLSIIEACNGPHDGEDRIPLAVAIQIADTATAEIITHGFSIINPPTVEPGTIVPTPDPEPSA